MNSPQQGKKPPVLAVCGVKNSGKTTFLTRILPLLRARGIQAGVIKHDGHDFHPDVPGTDSYRLLAAGAGAVAVYSRFRYMLVREEAMPGPEGLFPLFADKDILLLEGNKHTPYPKLEIVRAAVSARPVCDPRTLVALCTDTDLRLEGVPRLGLEEYEKAADLILRFRETGAAWFGP
jgi:molybdopterin-guanine dinucleotide biosynthesis protein B